MCIGANIVYFPGKQYIFKLFEIVMNIAQCFEQTYCLIVVFNTITQFVDV